MAKSKHAHRPAAQHGFAIRRSGLERCLCGAWRVPSICSSWWRNDG